jgi:hypothetical protein
MLPDFLFECFPASHGFHLFLRMLPEITCRAFLIIPFDVPDISRFETFWARFISPLIFPVTDSTARFHFVRIPSAIQIFIQIEIPGLVIDSEINQFWLSIFVQERVSMRIISLLSMMHTAMCTDNSRRPGMFLPHGNEPG